MLRISLIYYIVGVVFNIVVIIAFFVVVVILVVRLHHNRIDFSFVLVILFVVIIIFFFIVVIVVKIYIVEFVHVHWGFHRGGIEIRIPNRFYWYGGFFIFLLWALFCCHKKN